MLCYKNNKHYNRVDELILRHDEEGSEQWLLFMRFVPAPPTGDEYQQPRCDESSGTHGQQCIGVRKGLPAASGRRKDWAQGRLRPSPYLPALNATGRHGQR